MATLTFAGVNADAAWSVTGAATALDALSDADDGTYVTSPDTPSGAWRDLTLQAVERPAGAFTVTLRASRAADAAWAQITASLRWQGRTQATSAPLAPASTPGDLVATFSADSIEHLPAAAWQSGAMAVRVTVTAASTARDLAVTRSVTTKDQASLLAADTAGTWGGDVTDAATVIDVTATPASDGHSMVGAGAAMTDASAIVLDTLPAATRDRAMADLFDPVNGAGLAFLRLCIGSSDYTDVDYTLADTQGPGGDPLANFTMAKPDEHIVPRVQQALTINPDLTIMATPWSPPAWMRSGGTVYGDTGGTLLPAYYPVFADYLTRYVTEMAARGIPIHYLSIQNEPDFAAPYMGMTMTAAQQGEVIRDYVRPALDAAGHGGTGILGWDHNWDQDGGTAGNQHPFVDALLADATVRPALAGIAWHGYVGTPAAMTTVRAAYPDVPQYFTEVTEFGAITDWGADLAWLHRDVYDTALAAGARGLQEWNLALDTTFGPHTRASSDVRGLLQVDTAAGTYVPQPALYALAAVARAARPGSVQVTRALTNPFGIIYARAYRHPDGGYGLHVLNDGGTPQDCTLRWGGYELATSLAVGVTTFTWGGAYAPLSLPAPPAAEPVGEVTSHAYFYGPEPTDGTTVATLAGRTDYLILDLRRDYLFRDDVKATNPSAVIEGYVRFDAVREPQQAEIDGGWRYSNNACWEVTGGTYTWEAVNAQEAWFAHNTAGQRIGSTTSTTYWLMEPSNAGWRAFLRDSIIALEAYRPGSWDGIFLDNIERSLDKRTRYGMVPQVPGTGVAYTDAQWATATLDLLTWLRTELLAAGLGRVSGNVIEVGGAADPSGVWVSAAQHLDVAMEEFAGASWESPGYPSLASWLAALDRIEATPAATAALHVYDSGTNLDVAERRLFSYGSYLLSARGGDYFRWTHYNNHTEQWWDAAFDTALGAPTGPRANTGGNTWQRTFAGGTVTVDYDTKAVTISTWEAAWAANDQQVLLDWFNANTGPTVALTTSTTGTYTVASQADADALVGRTVTGRIVVTANCTMRDFRLVNDGSAGTALDIAGGLTVTVEDFEVDGAGHDTTVAGVGGGSWATVTMRRAHIHHCLDGVRLCEGSTYEHLFVHDPIYVPTYAGSSTQHADAVQAVRGATPIVVTRSWLDHGADPSGDNITSAAIIKSDAGAIDDVTIDYTYLNGGGYTVTIEAGANGAPTNIKVRNNRIGRGYRNGVWSGAGVNDGADYDLTGNVWADDLSPATTTWGLLPAASTATTASSPYTITGLTASTGYRVRVKSTNAEGDSAFTAWEPFTTTAAGGGGGGGAEFAYITDAQIAELSTTSAAALRAKALADDVKNGTTASNAADIKDVDTRVGAYCLAAAIWWKRTGDATYLAPLQTFIRARPKPPQVSSGTYAQALNEFRSWPGMFAAVQILRRNGAWDDAYTLPNHGGITWTEYLLGGATYPDSLAERRIDLGEGQRWRYLSPTAGTSAAQGATHKSPSNWGCAARASEVAYFGLLDDMGVAAGATGITANRAVLKHWLGDLTGGLPQFYSSGAYRHSWNNWTPETTGSGSTYIDAGVGKYDTGDPGLDGVLINDIDRGATDYSAGAAYWGASGSGLTYPLEAADFVWAQVAWYLNAGEAVRTWGEHGDALVRMNDHLARLSPNGLSLFDNGDAGSSVYWGIRLAAARTSGLADNGYGTVKASASGWGGVPRSSIYWDWLAESPGWAAGA